MTINPRVADLSSYLQNAQPRQLEELLEFLRIPSVSTDPERRGDVRRAAEFVRVGLERAGFKRTNYGDGGPSGRLRRTRR